MRLRVRLKSLAVLGVVSICATVYSLIGPDTSIRLWHTDKPRRVARISVEDLQAVRTLQAPNPTSAATQQTLNNYTQSAAVNSPCDQSCQFRQLREQKQETRMLKPNKQTQTVNTTNPNRAMNIMRSKIQHVKESLRNCDRACRIAKLKDSKRLRGGYVSRVQVENVTLPDSWTVTKQLVNRFSSRRNHVKEVCKKYGLDKPTETYQPNAWEFLVNEEYGLIWCNIFKAASSTWFYNFNLLARFTEAELLHSKETPIMLARLKYPRPTVNELMKSMNSTPHPLSFMIARHPLQRLVSGYRDKIMSGSRFYGKLSRKIVKQYSHLGRGEIRERPKSWESYLKSVPRAVVPSFPQFVQFLLDEAAKGMKLDEHWTPMSQFCTPCLIDFDVFAKVETLEEDGNYIIFSAGIEDVIKPKRINRSRNEPTDVVADRFLCQLSQEQMKGLLQLYKLDMELFEYDASKYLNCTEPS